MSTVKQYLEQMNDSPAAIYLQTGGCNTGGYLVWLPAINYEDGSGVKIRTDWAHPRSKGAFFKKVNATKAKKIK